MPDLTIPHNDDSIRQRQCLFLVMGYINHGNPEFFLQLFNNDSEAYPYFCIQGTQRFIKQQHLRLNGNRPPQRNPLLLPTAEL